MKGPNSWPVLINYKSLSCSEASQGESKEEDEKKKVGAEGVHFICTGKLG